MKKIITLSVLSVLLIAGCADKPSEAPQQVLPALPAKVTPVSVKWKVIADVREIDGKQFLVIPYDGNPYVALTYSDSLVFRSWLNDVKRKNDQTNNVLCNVGYKVLCSSEKKETSAK